MYLQIYTYTRIYIVNVYIYIYKYMSADTVLIGGLQGQSLHEQVPEEWGVDGYVNFWSVTEWFPFRTKFTQWYTKSFKSGYLPMASAFELSAGHVSCLYLIFVSFLFPKETQGERLLLSFPQSSMVLHIVISSSNTQGVGGCFILRNL